MAAGARAMGGSRSGGMADLAWSQHSRGTLCTTQHDELICERRVRVGAGNRGGFESDDHRCLNHNNSTMELRAP